MHIDGPDGDGAGTLLIPTSKTDREGQRAHAYLRRRQRARSIAGGTKAGSTPDRCSGGLRPTSMVLYDWLDRARCIQEQSELSTSNSSAKRSQRSCSAPCASELERWIAAISSHSIPGWRCAGQFRLERSTSDDHIGLSLARSQHCHALRRQTCRKKWRQLTLGKALRRRLI